jgi:GT2 family glycosyltransferase
VKRARSKAKPAAHAAADLARHSVAVLVPCYNEEMAIAKVVADFRAALPTAAIFVFDNNSTDRTVEAARAAGAAVESVSIGRNRLPPDEIKWFATSGIIVTSEPVRLTIRSFTRCRSARTSFDSRSIEGSP